jgi:IclR family transcriptional regulator, mhp operon transcriptional activator
MGPHRSDETPCDHLVIVLAFPGRRGAVLLKNVSQAKEVRAVRRALSVMDVLGEYGWLTPTELADRTDIDRGTVYRLLASMVGAGYVTRREQDGKFFLTTKLHKVSRGILDDDSQSLLVSQALARLTKQIKWPSDYAVINGGKLEIVDSSHHLTSMTFFRFVIGQNRPIGRTALGKAIIGAMKPAEIDSMLTEVLLLGGDENKDLLHPGKIERIKKDFETRGYALSEEETTPGICAVALPVMSETTVAGAVNVIIFRSAFERSKVEKFFIEPLKKCVVEIELEFAKSRLLQIKTMSITDELSQGHSV